jgi:mannose-6-phosphate isomerase
MLYPLTFEPILKKIIWGGSLICPFKGLEPEDGVGESWEISHVENNVSVVANGKHRGQTLDELIRIYSHRLLGKKVLSASGSTFPLLVKFIDARDNLSVQVHPDDTLARKRHNSFGKTEMWYVVKAGKGAALYSGFSRKIDAEEYVKRVEDNTIMEVLQRHEVHEGDVFFLPAGRVHAIGAGCFIAEIQQTSNITYRIYDYNRKDAGGKGRELHTEQAKDAIDYRLYSGYRTWYNAYTDATVSLVECKYFTTNLLDLRSYTMPNLSGRDSFVIYICMEGKAILEYNGGRSKMDIRQGQTVLIPAAMKRLAIMPSPQVKLMETYVG